MKPIESVDRARVAVAPVERAYREYEAWKMMASTVVVIAVTAIAVVGVFAKWPFVALGIAGVGLVMVTSIAQMNSKRRRLKALWREWPVERSESDPYTYRRALNEHLLPLARYDVAIASGVALSFLIFGLQPLVSGGPWWSMPLAVLMAAVFGFSGYLSARRRSAAERGLQAAASSSDQVVPGVAERAAHERDTSRIPVRLGDDVEIRWRGSVMVSGVNERVGNDGVVREKFPHDALVVTNLGLHLVNVVEPGQPWDMNTGAPTLTGAERRLNISDGLAFGRFPGAMEKKFDAVVATHGYSALVAADPRNLIYDRRQILMVKLTKTRFTRAQHVEIHLVTGEVSKWGLVVMTPRIEELRSVLHESGLLSS